MAKNKGSLFNRFMAPLVALGLLAVVLGLQAPAASAADACQHDTLCHILEQGVLKVGVVVDYKPWGFRGKNGGFLGMEPDMARDVAKTLGVKIQFVPVNSANRMEFLEQGQIDLMIATMSDTPARRKVVGIVHPNYFASGYNIIMPKQVNPPDWNALKGQKICAVQGSWYNKPAEQKYGLQLLAFTGVVEAESALQKHRCVGFLFDDNLIGVMLAKKSGPWEKYHMPLPSEGVTPWGVAVRLSDLNKPWGRFISGMLYHWHRSGFFLSLVKKYGLGKSVFLDKKHHQMEDYTLKEK